MTPSAWAPESLSILRPSMRCRHLPVHTLSRFITPTTFPTLNLLKWDWFLISKPSLRFSAQSLVHRLRSRAHSPLHPPLYAKGYRRPIQSQRERENVLHGMLRSLLSVNCSLATRSGSEARTRGPPVRLFQNYWYVHFVSSREIRNVF
jgi:hypothetical protein